MSGVFDDDEDYPRVPVNETGNRAFGRVWISHVPWQVSVIGYHFTVRGEDSSHGELT